jgi:hypothetical protein
MKSFKTFRRLLEEKDTEFNSFVEEVITTNKIEPNKAKDFLIPKYNYTGLIYRVVFHPKATVEQYMVDDNIDTKGLSQMVASKFNHDRYVFFSKSLNGIKAMINYPSLYNVNENLVGVVFSIQPAASIDMTKYDGQNILVNNRLDSTEELLSFEDMNIKNIDALYLYDEGWHFVTDFHNRVHPKFKFKGGYKEPEQKEDDIENELEVDDSYAMEPTKSK